MGSDGDDIQFPVGTKVIIVESIGRTFETEGVVTKVGRRWAEVDTGSYRPRVIDARTGMGKEESRGFGARHRGFTPEGLERKKERDDLLAQLRPLVRSDPWQKMTADELRSLLAALEIASIRSVESHV